MPMMRELPQGRGRRRPGRGRDRLDRHVHRRHDGGCAGDDRDQRPGHQPLLGEHRPRDHGRGAARHRRRAAPRPGHRRRDDRRAGGRPVRALGNRRRLPDHRAAPSSVAECYSLTRGAFDLAERFRCPVFVLADKELEPDDDHGRRRRRSASPRLRLHERKRATATGAAADSPVPLRARRRTCRRCARTAEAAPGALHRLDPRRAGRSSPRTPPRWRAERATSRAKIEAHRDEIEMVTRRPRAGRRHLVRLATASPRARCARPSPGRARAGAADLGARRCRASGRCPSALSARRSRASKRVVVAELNQGQYRREIERLAAGREVVGLNRVDGELIAPEDSWRCCDARRTTRQAAAGRRGGRPAMSTTITPLATYRNETPYPFCPGCGHGPILDHLNAALVTLQLDPRRVVIVSDIGCSGLSDQYFDTSAFHGLHGRSITYATGIKLARPELDGHRGHGRRRHRHRRRAPAERGAPQHRASRCWCSTTSTSG